MTHSSICFIKPVFLRTVFREPSYCLTDFDLKTYGFNITLCNILLLSLFLNLLSTFLFFERKIVSLWLSTSSDYLVSSFLTIVLKLNTLKVLLWRQLVPDRKRTSIICEEEWISTKTPSLLWIKFCWLKLDIYLFVFLLYCFVTIFSSLLYWFFFLILLLSFSLYVNRTFYMEWLKISGLNDLRSLSNHDVKNHHFCSFPSIDDIGHLFSCIRYSYPYWWRPKLLTLVH